MQADGTATEVLKYRTRHPAPGTALSTEHLAPHWAVPPPAPPRMVWSAACDRSWEQSPSRLASAPRGRRPRCRDRRSTNQLCARCHGGDGRGGQMGPGIVARLAARSDAELTALVRDGVPAKGMPGAALAGPELRQLLAFLKTLRASDDRGRAASQSRDARWRHARRRRAEPVHLRPAVARRRRAPSLVATVGQPVPPRDLRRGLARLSRAAHWKSIQPPRSDRPRQRLAAGARVDVRGLRRRAASGHAGRRWRSHVRHPRQRVLCTRRGIGPAHLALPAAAHQGPGRRRRSRNQSRCGGQRRSRLHGHRRCAARSR